jgi:nitrogen fixation/metabolism regulation signal transduction histidine kinase
MLSLTITYSLIIFVLMAIPVFRPLMQALDNPALSWQERAVAATDLLNLHARYWPWALGAGLVLLIHCIHSLRIMHHIAGPLYRFKHVFRQISDGNLSIKTTLRQGDYLIPEAELVNQMTAQLQARVSASKTGQATVALDVERLKQAVATENDPTLATLIKQMELDLADLKSSLDWFKTHKG